MKILFSRIVCVFGCRTGSGSCRSRSSRGGRIRGSRRNRVGSGSGAGGCGRPRCGWSSRCSRGTCVGSGCGGWSDCGGRRNATGAIDNRTNPQGSVAGRNTGRQNGQDKLNILASQGTQIYIDGIKFAFMPLKERTPERLDRITSRLIVNAEGHITIGGTRLTVDDRAEAVTRLYFERRVKALDISVLDILRESDQAGACVRCAIFQFGVAHLEYKALCIAIRSRAGERTHTTKPRGRAGARGKVISGIARKVLRSDHQELQ